MIREECAQTIAHIASQLSWNHYMALFRRVFNCVGQLGACEL